MSRGLSYEKPFQGASNDWWTPPGLVESLGQFDLDPCAGIGQDPLANHVYTLPQDGLTLPWRGRVWCNPPYGPHVRAWAEKMAFHRNGILLIFARTETRTWQMIWRTADGILFPFRRISFSNGGSPSKSGTAPSALVAYGPKNLQALRRCGVNGALLDKWEIYNDVKGG